MSDEQLVNFANDARVINAADQVIFPLLRKLKDDRLNLAAGKFLNGEASFIGDIAYIQALRDIENQLRKMVTAGNKANMELNKSQL